MTKTKQCIFTLVAAVCLALVGCSKSSNQPTQSDRPVQENTGLENSEFIIKGETATTSLGAETWPTSMSQFKFPFSGVYNNYHGGQVWKIVCGYGCGLHKYSNYPRAGYYSVDLIRDDGSASSGSYVLAPARGKVIFADKMTGYGWCVVMDHDAGHTGQKYTSISGHLLSDPKTYVRVGDDLLQGTVLGKCGNSGTSVTHIHFSVWKNNVSVPLNGISGGPGLIEGGRYCSGNSLVPPPHGF